MFAARHRLDASVLIHGGVLLLWALLFVRAFAFDGPLAWSAGVVYVGDDAALLAFVFWQTRELSRPSPGGFQPTGRRATLTVVVAARDEARVLPATLGAQFAQTELPDEIVIADDGSTDGTAALLEGEYGLGRPVLGTIGGPSACHPTLRWLRLPHGGKARALNATSSAQRPRR